MLYPTPQNKIVVQGTPFVNDRRVQTAANVYPGRLVKRGTTDDDIVVCTAGGSPCGWAGYEQSSPEAKPDNITCYHVVEQ